MMGSLHAFMAEHRTGNPEGDAELRRRWRRQRPQGMKWQRPTSRTSSLRGRFYRTMHTIRGSMTAALRSADRAAKQAETRRVLAASR